MARADNGDPDARAAIMELAPAFSAGAATLLALFGSIRILLDGLFADLLRYAAPEIQLAIAYHRPALTSHPVDLVPAQLGNSATLLGAAEGAIAAFLDQL